MKRFSSSIISLVILLGINGCGDKQDENNIEKHSQINTYSNLPVKKDLSYFNTPENIVGFDIFRTSTFYKYNNNQGLNPTKIFTIDKYNLHSPFGDLSINHSNISEFEMDDFEKKLHTELEKTINKINTDFKNTDLHIRITNLDIPVKYSKATYGSHAIELKIEDLSSLKKLEATQTINLTNTVKNLINNKNINDYIIPSNKQINLSTLIDTPKNNYVKGEIYIYGDSNTLDALGKKNHGKDMIEEITLHSLYLNSLHRNKIIMHFIITGFKLKNINSRFVLNQSIKNINLSNGYKNNFILVKNNETIK